jgi:ABC-2 type transport system ATP-binding protein
MIQLRDLTKTYGAVHAVRGLTFQIPKGQVVGFLGPNGAGKSTTMKMLTGYLLPTSGRAMIAGMDVSENPVEIRKYIGYLPENNALYEDMIVLDYLNFVAQMRSIPKSQRAKNIRQAAERCGLGPVLGKDIGNLSKGFRQRVGLAQAIVHEPPLLILDEPTSGLDPNQIVEIRELIKELGKEKTILMSTHILSEAQTTCSRVLIINDGKLVADDTPEQLAAMGGGAVYVVVAPKGTSAFVPSQVETLLRNIQGVTRVESAETFEEGCLGFTLRYTKEDPRRELFERAVLENWVLIEMRRKEATLEESFRRLTME